MSTFLTTDEEEEELSNLRDDTHEALFAKPQQPKPPPKSEPESPPKPEPKQPTAEAPTESTAQTPVAQFTEQQRIDKLADIIRNFNIVMSGGASLLGGFGKLPDNGVTLDHLEKSFTDFKLVGTDGVQAYGSLEKGYVLHGNPEGPAAVEGFPNPSYPPGGIVRTGACCASDGSCSITTEVGCVGDYQGDDTVCDPNPCPTATGACCAGDGSCSITTEAACVGVYQGNDTVCDPNPCPPTGACCVDGVCSQRTEAGCTGTFQGVGVPCTPDPCISCGGCAFLNLDDGRYYKTRTIHTVAYYLSTSMYHPDINANLDNTKIQTYNESCDIDCSDSFGTGGFSYEPGGGMDCHCTWNFFCDDPIVAFGFRGVGGLTLTSTCDCCDPDFNCDSGSILVCDFGECHITSQTYTYSDPCINE